MKYNLEVEPSNSDVHIINNTNIWNLHFNISKSQEGPRVDCILGDPKGKITIMAFRLEFECTNNIVEYEALFQGLKGVVYLKVKHIKVFGDFKIIVKYVNNSMHCKSGHLKGYQHEVWQLKSLFDYFEIISIPRNQNTDVDILANVTSRLLPT